MRAAVATILALVVLAGSTVLVAANVDTAAAQYRAKAQAELDRMQAEGDGCGCTADVRAKDRIASRDTAETTAGG